MGQIKVSMSMFTYAIITIFLTMALGGVTTMYFIERIGVVGFMITGVLWASWSLIGLRTMANMKIVIEQEKL